MPITAIVTPSTLSVEAAPSSEAGLHHVPYLNFSSLNFAAGMPRFYQSPYAYYASYGFTGPSQALNRVVEAVSHICVHISSRGLKAKQGLESDREV